MIKGIWEHVSFELSVELPANDKKNYLFLFNQISHFYYHRVTKDIYKFVERDRKWYVLR